MTLPVTQYFRTYKNDRKKEPRYLNVIDKDSCTSCEACASVCPVDCIYEVSGEGPSQSYHQIDTSRCIGCQLCYRSPKDSNQYFTLTLCPWNAIDIVHNPARQLDASPIFQAYWCGATQDLPWQELEEYGYQLFLNGEVFLPSDAQDLNQCLDFLRQAEWLSAEDTKDSIVEQDVTIGTSVRYTATEKGRTLLSAIFENYRGIFLD